MTTISFGLDNKSIRNAIKKLKVYSAEIDQNLSHTVDELLIIGSVEAVQTLENGLRDSEYHQAFGTGSLMSSIHKKYHSNRSKIGELIAHARHAAFVEFGTGPNAGGYPIVPEGGSSVLNHRSTPWAYMDPNIGYRPTFYGQKSIAYMARASIKMRGELPRVVRDNFT